MKTAIIAGLLLGAAHGMTLPVEAHDRHHGHHHHHEPRHNHCHRHLRSGYAHCHSHTHGGRGRGHHGQRYLHPIPVWYPGSLELHFQF